MVLYSMTSFVQTRTWLSLHDVVNRVGMSEDESGVLLQASKAVQGRLSNASWTTTGYRSRWCARCCNDIEFSEINAGSLPPSVSAPTQAPESPYRYHPRLTTNRGSGCDIDVVARQLETVTCVPLPTVAYPRIRPCSVVPISRSAGR